MSAPHPLGRGPAFPLRPFPRSGAPQARGLEYAEGADKVQQSIVLILETEPGERVMRPDFGCGLRRYLMKPNSVAVRALLRADVERALRAFEPRIDLTSVQVLPGEDPAQVDIHIAYVHTRDRRPGNLIYPFYLE